MSTDDLIVNVWNNSQNVDRGVLRIKEDYLLITLESGKVISSEDTANVLYSPIEDPHNTQCRIIFNPILAVTRPYAADIGQAIEDIFPPSSGGFYGRLRAGQDDAVYIVQKIERDTRHWLTIGDSRTGRIYETQVIQPYEVETLKLLDDHDLRNSWFTKVWSDKEESLRKEILGVLDEPSPSWEGISKLVSEVAIPNLKLGETVRDTVSPLVPNSFPESIREQLMAFLAYVVMSKMQMVDVIDSSSLTDAMPLFGSLIRGHYRCVVDNQTWPPYLKLMILASRNQLEQPKVTIAELTSETWRILWQKVIELCPNWFGNAIISAKELNDSNSFRSRLPVTKTQAMRSRKLWKKRLAAISYGLRVRAHVNPNTIGLTELVYLGAAYRWPHRHMRFITRLGIISDNPAHLQVMTMPPSSVERVMRVLPQCIKVSTSTRTVNLDLYDDDSGKWKVPIERILASLYRKSSMKRISKRFAGVIQSDTHQITPDEAKVLGLISAGVYLQDFERPGYFRYWDMSRKQVFSIISRLQRKGVIQVAHEVDDVSLVSLASIIQGNKENVISLVDSFLTNTPTSTVMLNEECDKGIVLSRLPEDRVHELVSEFNQQGIQQDIVIRCMRPRTFRSFTFNLYHRLLRDNGIWDDNVSAFLSQARSMRKELSESNA
ncbi:MAG: hypothetical protein KGD60_08975 [Candidatus Thorarchaeota archaeon]|nr:hypothetical protein [Candidatus Thorarchaeota archaeon]